MKLSSSTRRLLGPFVWCVLVPLTVTSAPLNANEGLSWGTLASLPDAIGFAGPFCGTDGAALMVAGGANFPDRPPWEGGKKIWHDRIFILENSEGTWLEVGELRRPLGYGVSLSLPAGTAAGPGVVCLGGSDAERHYADCFILRWKNQKIEIVDLPSLPRPLANACGAILGDTIYVAGGIETPESTRAQNCFVALNLSQNGSTWQELEAWPGVGRMLAVAAVQDKAFYLCGGAELFEDEMGKPVRRYLDDCYRFKPGEGWRRIADLPRPAVAAPSPAPALGQSSFLVLGGDDGSLVDFPLLQAHPGFPKTVLAYHTITDTWKTAGEMPFSQVTTGAVLWQGQWVIPTGEVKPGVRSPEVWTLRARSLQKSFGLVNTGTVAAYLLLMVWIGWVCSQKNQTTNDYFRGGQRIPWWAAGLSIFATMLSAITYMAIPAAAYTDGWTLFLANTYIIIMPLIVFVFLPFYRRLDVTSAYEYLERRFNLSTRLAGSMLFILYQCGRMAVVLYLPSLALATVTDLEVETCIVGIGLLCIVYTVLGGIEAVIWTDVVQAIVLIAGAIISIVYLTLHLDGGITDSFSIASEGGRIFESVNWSWDLTVASAWVIMIGALFHHLLPYAASQDVVQRYLTTSDEQTAARGIWLNALLSVPAQAAFFLIGTGLYVFYRQHPERMDLTLQNDAVFPFFVVRELPLGLAGLIVAGVFSASQSTLSSSMNSIATAYVTDFYRRLLPSRTDGQCMVAARWVTVLVGAIGIVVALTLAKTDIRSAYSTFIEILGLLGGMLSGLFVLGIFTRRATGAGAIGGALTSAAVLCVIRWYQPLQVFAYAPIGLLTCFFSGWLLSFLLPSRRKDLAGLTLYDKPRR
jgi:SSS family solute:Na+ symporter